jgi:molybdate transport system regulatory protein
MKPKPSGEPQLQVRLRIVGRGEVALGPGKVDLLGLIDETGSLRKAAERMDMSYMRAWLLVRTMNLCFKQPVVASLRGGRTGGGAQLTETGRQVLELYRLMERTSLRAMDRDWKRLRGLLRA